MNLPAPKDEASWKRVTHAALQATCRGSSGTTWACPGYLRSGSTRTSCLGTSCDGTMPCAREPGYFNDAVHGGKRIRHSGLGAAFIPALKDGALCRRGG